MSSLPYAENQEAANSDYPQQICVCHFVLHRCCVRCHLDDASFAFDFRLKSKWWDTVASPKLLIHPNHPEVREGLHRKQWDYALTGMGHV